LVGKATTDTLTNKSISGATNTLSNIGNASLTNSTISGKALGTNLDALTISTGLSGTTYNGSSAVTIAIDSTVATTSGTQTLTNKTITSPIINTPRLVGTVSDTNGAEMIEITATGSAANHFSITNASTGNPATLAAVGSDSDVALGLQGKNRGPVQFRSAQQYLVQDITSTSQAIILERVLTKFEAGGAIAATLANSVFVGQHKVLANNGSGNVVVTPATFKNGTSITIRPKGVAQLLWIDNTDGWMIMGPKEYDSSDAAALYFIT